MVEIDIRNNEIHLEGQSRAAISITFEYRIAKALPFHNAIVVLFDPRDDGVPNENIVAVDSNGQRLWAVNERSYGQDECPYTEINAVNGELWACGWDGMSVMIDTVTGEIISCDMTK